MGLFSFFRRKKKKADEAAVRVQSRKPKVALCLGGGGARGFAHIGALKAFAEAGIDFDLCCGTSVGSLVGAFYCAGIDIDDLVSYAHELEIKDVKTSKLLIGSDPLSIGRIFTRRMGNMNIEDLLKPFSCVAVDLVTGKQVIFDSGSVSNAISSSCAVPIVFRPVVLKDQHLVDGGVLNNIPTSVCKMLGADFVVTVDVNATRGGGTNELGLLDVIKATYNIMSAQTSEEGLRMSDVIVSCDLSKFSAAKKDGYMEMIQIGYDAAKEKIEDIKKLFETEIF
ncbi:MAG: patatin-like phospholipase family protein [Clostridia bacterium]|nr:patatin-like phospholipase family protein [Clostridia bacterium]